MLLLMAQTSIPRGTPVRAFEFPGLVLAIVVGAWGCSAEPRSSPRDTSPSGRQAQASVLPGCPRSSVNTSGWQKVGTSDGKLVFNLPVGHSRSAHGPPEAWVWPGGEVGYHLSASDQHRIDSVSADPASPSSGWCTEQIAGKTVVIQYVYASPAAGPGFYMTAYWRVGPDLGIWLAGRVHDTTKAATLLEIARSVNVITGSAAR